VQEPAGSLDALPNQILVEIVASSEMNVLVYTS
jgi:hypothetical protein